MVAFCASRQDKERIVVDGFESPTFDAVHDYRLPKDGRQITAWVQLDKKIQKVALSRGG